jgi:DNA replication initiation complex subunit (GINS family)
MLTYDAISRAVEQERISKTLVGLPEGFFEDARLYIESKSKVSGVKDDPWELENAKRLLQDLMEIRERKILTLSLYFVRSGVSPNNMAGEEKAFFDSIVQSLRSFQLKKKEMVEGRPEVRWTVAMLDGVQEFLDTGLKKYGPYEKGDIVSMPEDFAKLLVGRGIAKRMEI